MPRKKKSRRRAGRSAIAPWILLSGSLAIIGFACSRTPQATHPVHSSSPIARPAARTTPVGHIPATTAPLAQTNGSPAVTAAPAAAVRAGGAATPTAIAPSSQPASPATASSPAAPAATHSPASSAAPRLALIIDDCGQWLDTERGFIALPIALTMSVLPDVPFNHTIEREAVEGNKGVMLHLPMETLSGLNPGPGKVTTEMNDAAIVAQVDRDLDDVDLARGVNNHEGSKATANVRVMNAVMTVLARRGRFFIDSKTNGASVAQEVATQHGVAAAGRDVFLDNRADVAYTEGQLREAATLAKRDGSAIAIGHPRPTTLAAVRAMLPELRADGITFTLAADLAH